jgi:hypothetical protein
MPISDLAEGGQVTEAAHASHFVIDSLRFVSRFELSCPWLRAFSDTDECQRRASHPRLFEQHDLGEEGLAGRN